MFRVKVSFWLIPFSTIREPSPSSSNCIIFQIFRINVKIRLLKGGMGTEKCIERRTRLRRILRSIHFMFQYLLCSRRRRLLTPGGFATAATSSSRSHREGGASGDDYK